MTTFEQLTKPKKQCGDKVIQVYRNMLIGYEIVNYKNYEPYEVKRVISKYNNPLNQNSTTWDDAYDLLFGVPTQPNFNKVLNI